MSNLIDILHKYGHFFMQFFIFTFSKLLYARHFAVKVDSLPPATGPHIFVANHQHRADPFTLIASMRYRDFFKYGPFAFMTATKYFKINPLLTGFLWIAGCYPSHEYKSSLYGIEAATNRFKKGYSLLIFPEGKLVRPGQDRPDAKNGILRILVRINKNQIILMKINWVKRNGDHKYIVIKTHDADLNQPASKIMDRIYSLKD